MEYRRKQINNLTLSLIFLTLLTGVAIGQKKQRTGHLYGHVVMSVPNDKYGQLLPGATVELLRVNKGIIKIVTNEGGLIVKDLPVGKYQLLSVKNADEELLIFSQRQNLYFEIKTNKTIRFDIDVLK